MKQAKTIQEQISILEERGVTINDEAKAEEQLLDIGYYRLGFYAFPFERSFPQLKDRDHVVVSGTTFDDIVNLYYFDTDLRNTLMYYLNRIEINIRTYISYQCSIHYKSNPTWFASKSFLNASFVDRFEREVYATIKRNPVIIRHHKAYANDRFAPAWKTLEFMTLGNICLLYENLRDDSLKKVIANHYGCSVRIFIQYIDIVRQVRNSCAHGACIFHTNLPKGICNGPAGNTSDCRHNLKGAILVISYMLNHISLHKKSEMQLQLGALFEKAKEADLRGVIHYCTGFCDNYFDINE